MGQRLQLQMLFEEILASSNVDRNVYFQPPASIVMKYPAIVYKRDNVDTDYADNSPYRHMKRYSATVIDMNPDSEIPDKVAELPLCSFARHFTANNLNHDVYNLYF